MNGDGFLNESAREDPVGDLSVTMIRADCIFYSVLLEVDLLAGDRVDSSDLGDRLGVVDCILARRFVLDDLLLIDHFQSLCKDGPITNKLHCKI